MYALINGCCSCFQWRTNTLSNVNNQLIFILGCCYKYNVPCYVVTTELNKIKTK